MGGEPAQGAHRQGHKTGHQQAGKPPYQRRVLFESIKYASCVGLCFHAMVRTICAELMETNLRSMATIVARKKSIKLRNLRLEWEGQAQVTNKNGILLPKLKLCRGFMMHCGKRFGGFGRAHPRDEPFTWVFLLITPFRSLCSPPTSTT